MLITTSSELVDFCDALRDAPYIAVDTEFMREKNYYATLCLVQVAYGDHAAAIDPLAPDIDLRPLGDLLHDASIVKVLHAATQDLEIFLDKTGEVPTPIFDTQIAASVCGLGEQPGYAKLVSEMLGIQIDKSSQMTDWSLRPLTDRQLTYALADVTHLCVVYEKILAELERTGRAPWVAEEMEALHDPTRYRVDPEEAYRRIKIRRPKPHTLAVLRGLAAWREREAMASNVPRGWVVKDDALVEIAMNLPESIDDLARVRALKPHMARGKQGEELLDAVELALSSPKESWPVVEARRAPLSGHEGLVGLLQALLEQRCSTHGVAKSMVARRDDLDLIATQAAPDVPAMKGWRRRIFGEDALALCAGTLALTGRDGVVVDVRTDG